MLKQKCIIDICKASNVEKIGLFSFSWRSADADFFFFFSFSLWLNKHASFLTTQCWLIVGEDSFPRGGVGQPLCQSRECENGGDRMLMRRPEQHLQPLCPSSAPLCKLVMNLWISSLIIWHPVIPNQPHFQPGEQQKQANIRRMLSIQYWPWDLLFAEKQHISCAA